MERSIAGPVTSRSQGGADGGRAVIKNRALKPRRVIPVGPPTAQGARPGRNDGPEWLHRATAEHVFPNLPPEPAAPVGAGRRRAWLLPAAIAGGTVAIALGVLAFVL